MREFVSFLKQIKITKKEIINNKNNVYRYYNFWKIKDPNKVWFSRFIEYRNLNPNQKPINFISVFGSAFTHLLLPSPKVFFTGEDVNNKSVLQWKYFRNNLIGKVDLSLGFADIQHDDYTQLPLWMISLFEPDSNLEDIQTTINIINAEKLKANKKISFCSQISRHDTNGVREEIINLLKDVGEIDCAGVFMNNTNKLQEEFGDNKIEFLKNYKFNICPENSDSKGYITEKLIDAFKAGSIPIYWSKKNIEGQELFNKNAILFYDENNPEELLKTVKHLWNDENAYREYIKIPVFQDDAAEKIWERFNFLADKFEKIIKKH